MTPATTQPGCRHSLEELNEYLRTGQPRLEPHLRNCLRCRSSLQGLRRLEDLTEYLVQNDMRRVEAEGTLWLDRIVAQLRLEPRVAATPPPRSLPTQGPVPPADGFLLALIRSTGDSLAGATIGRCQVQGDRETPSAGVRVQVNLSARWGHSLPDLVRTLRQRLFDSLTRHTTLDVEGIDITVTDVYDPRTQLARPPVRGHTAVPRSPTAESQ